MEFLGIDIGGTGIKGAPVDVENGNLLAERYRLQTPEASTPEQVAATVAEVTRFFNWSGPVGCGFPAAVRSGMVMTAANIDKSWIGVNAPALFGAATGCHVHVVNDADAAGLAEMRFGAGKNRKGVVLIVTIGTGLGTCMFTDGHLVPNLELGHIEIDCKDAEILASDAARKRDDLSLKKWAKRFNIYLTRMEQLLWPDLIILGGGISKRHEEFIPLLNVNAQVVPAQLLNNAGIVGAALAAQLAETPG